MKKTIGLLVIGLLCARADAQILDPSTGHYYEVFTAANITWANAETAALALPKFDGLQGHLATITSAEEDGFVAEAVAAVSSINGGPGEYWLGGFQNPGNELTANVGWTWVNNEGTFPGVNGATGFDNAYSNWNPGEPNDAQGPGSEQFLGINHGSVGGFNDEGDLSLIGGYVVEFDPNTVPNGGLPPGFVPDGASTSLLLMGAMSLLAGAAKKFRR